MFVVDMCPNFDEMGIGMISAWVCIFGRSVEPDEVLLRPTGFTIEDKSIDAIASAIVRSAVKMASCMNDNQGADFKLSVAQTFTADDDPWLLPSKIQVACDHPSVKLTQTTIKQCEEDENTYEASFVFRRI